jgi:NAD dependent epimerase/dehydratase family
MRVLLTGGSGNLGQALVPRLLDRGDTPVILDVRAPRSLNEGAVFIEASILDRSKLTEIFRGCDGIVHIAAWHGIHEDRTGKRRSKIPHREFASIRREVEAPIPVGVAARFAADSPLEGSGFELVWGFSCQVVVSGFWPVLCSERESRFSSRRLGSGSRSARKGIVRITIWVGGEVAR